MSVGGLVRYYGSGLAVSGTTVQLHDLTAGGGTTAATMPTGTDGQFAFDARLLTNWEVQPQKAGDVGTGVDINDAVLILKASVGQVTLSPLQQLAGDVTGDGRVDVTDAVFLLKYTIGTVARFPVAQTCNSDWAFVANPDPVANQQIIPPQITSICQPNGAIRYNPLITAASGQNFSAVLFGDCDHSWRPSGTGALVAQAAGSPLQAQRSGRHGQTLRVPVALTTAGTQGLSADLSYDPAQMTPLGVRSVVRTGQVLLESNLATPGRVRVALIGTAPLPRGAAFVVEFQLRHPRAAAPAVQIQHATVTQ